MTSKHTGLRAAAGGLIAATVLGGCMVGPDFARPDPPKDKSYLSDSIEETVATNDILGGEAQRFVQDLDIPGQWWLVFESRTLDELIARSLQANPDIQAAIAALKVAQQNARAQRAALFPTIGVLGSGSNNQISNALSPATAQPTSIFGLFTALITVSYNLDVFGGVRRNHLEPGPVCVHDVDIRSPGAIGGEGDLPSARRPLRRYVYGLAGDQRLLVGPVGVHRVDVVVTAAVRLEHDCREQSGGQALGKRR